MASSSPVFYGTTTTPVSDARDDAVMNPLIRDVIFIINSPQAENDTRPHIRECLCFYCRVVLTLATSPLFRLKKCWLMPPNLPQTTSQKWWLTSSYFFYNS